MPFGLTGAPATWQRIVDQMIGADLQPYVFVYLDEIVLVSQDFDTFVVVESGFLSLAEGWNGS